jgi:hypothetical protein
MKQIKPIELNDDETAIILDHEQVYDLRKRVNTGKELSNLDRIVIDAFIRYTLNRIPPAPRMEIPIAK